MSEASSPGLTPVDTHHGDDVDVQAIVIWGLVSVFITLITIFALHAMYNMSADEQRVEKSYNAPYTAAASALDRQASALEQPLKWLDQSGDKVGVPIGVAMKLTLEHFQQQQEQ
jgi:hypothetical protein